MKTTAFRTRIRLEFNRGVGPIASAPNSPHAPRPYRSRIARAHEIITTVSVSDPEWGFGKETYPRNKNRAMKG